MNRSAIVIGAGIVGLATARALAISGYEVMVIDRSAFATGASVRNFGMVWPIGQPEGLLRERALRTRAVWESICKESGMWNDPSGSLHLAYCESEMEVLENFIRKSGKERSYRLLTSSEVMKKSSCVVHHGLRGGLYSADELIVDPPTAISRLAAFLQEKYSVRFSWNTHAHSIEQGRVSCGKVNYEADEVFICSGADFRNLLPESFIQEPITICKLQMMRLGPQPAGWQLGPSLCGGLSLLHYAGFRLAGSSLEGLREYIVSKYPDYVRWGIHVMVAQHASGELVIGDSHEYGDSHDPFDKAFINRMILEYLFGFARFPSESISASWNGQYSKLTDGRTELVLRPAPGVTIINALGGAGMTMSFGLAEEVVGGRYGVL